MKVELFIMTDFGNKDKSRVGKRWDKEEEDAILRLFKEGKKYSEIAKIQNRKQPGIKARFEIIAERMRSDGTSEEKILASTGIKSGEKSQKIAPHNQKEQHCKRSIEAKFPGHEFKKVRLDKFINPETGRKLELDLYNEELKLAIEYNGRQHYEFVKYFHGEMEEFEKQKVRDTIKEGYCDIFKIELIEIPALQTYEEIDKFIEQSLYARGIMYREKTPTGPDKVRALTDDLVAYIKIHFGSITDLLDHRYAGEVNFSSKLDEAILVMISKSEEIKKAYDIAFYSRNASCGHISSSHIPSKKSENNSAE
jgi:hypothetical protein